jgi:hypothetical protein
MLIENLTGVWRLILGFRQSHFRGHEAPRVKPGTRGQTVVCKIPRLMSKWPARQRGQVKGDQQRSPFSV